MGLFDSIFGTPNKDKADAAQKDIEHSQRSRGNQLHNIETVSKQYKELAIRKHAKRYSENVYNAGIKAQGRVFKTAEHLARIKATGGSVAEGGRSRTGKKGGGRSNEGLMLLSKLYQAENLKRFTSGERSSALQNSALLELQSNQAKAIAKVGPGVGAKRGVTYVKDNNALKFAQLAISVATGDFGGAFGSLGAGGGNASMLQWMGGKSTTKGWTGLGGP
tara:strand:+ start:1635 stop:2294 length:660 start_codon:yes stop_codon:yes gene_type:complete